MESRRTYTDASKSYPFRLGQAEVQIDALIKERAALVEILEALVGNARLVPDPSMSGATDAYLVPVGDIIAARLTVEKSRYVE